MSRKRYISTDLSTDSKIAELSEHGYLPIILYTWSIPHMDDWGRITGDARQFKLLVCPGFDATVKEINECLDLVAKVGLWERYEVDGKKCISISSDRWFKHQSYINKGKRDDDSGSNYPNPDKKQETTQNTEEHRGLPKIEEEQREEPQNPVSFSSSFSSSPTLTSTVDADASEPSKKGFIKPTVEEVTEYCNERKNDVDPMKWHSHYSSNGWKVGRNSMKDWKAAVRTWERDSYSNGSSTVGRTGQASYRKDNNQNGINKGQIVGIVSGTDLGF